MSERYDPIVPHVMLAADQRTRLYDLPDIRRVPVLWHTATTVRYEFDNGHKKQWTTGQERVWCVPDDDAWAEIEESYTAWREALRAFAQVLRRLGTYERRLKEAGDGAPNPLTPTVIIANNPDGWQGYFHGDNLFLMPGETAWRPFERAVVQKHTPKMVRLESDSLIEQTRCFACEDDHDWEAANGAMLAARDARDAFHRVLNKYGTYGRGTTRAEYERQKQQQEEPVIDIPTTADEREEISAEIVELIEILWGHGYDAVRIDQEHWQVWEQGSEEGSERTVDIAGLRDLAASLESTHAPAAPELRDLPIDQLHPHPDNPRITLREEIVTGLAAQMQARGFSREYALLVRPHPDGYQIISGHQRTEAAKRAGLTEVPCWVRVMSDAEAYMELGMGNTQGELTPLEVGLHALGSVELGKGGRGERGGISDYARALGRNDGYMRRLVAAARVYAAVKPVSQGAGFEARTKHLAEIARAPEAYWASLVDQMLQGDWSVETTRQAVDEAMAVALSEEELTELQRQVRRRGGIYHGERRINGVVTRHNVTLPGQQERQYTTEQLREVLTAFPEREERLPERLAAWQIEEWPDDPRIVARHTATGVHTHLGTLKQIIEEANHLHLDLERLHANGWTFGRIDDTGEWTGTHPNHGEVYGPELPTLFYRADLARDRSLAEQIRRLTEQEQFDEAERLVLAMHNNAAKDEEMRVLAAAMRKASERAQRARWEAEPGEQQVFRSGDYVVHQGTQGLYQVDQPMGLGRYQIVALFHDVAPTRTVFANTLQRASEEQVRQWRAAHQDARPEPAFEPSPVSVALDDQFEGPAAAGVMQRIHNLIERAEQEMPAWTFWVDEDGEACGGMHDSGYKIGPMESVIGLVNEAILLTPLLAEFAEHKWTCGYHVGLDLWTAEHMQYGTVQANSLPDLAFSAYLARYDRREPDLPRDLWRATWLEGWQFEGHLSGDRYRFVRSGEAWEPTFDELCHVYSYEPQPTPAAAPAPAAPRRISAQLDTGELRAIWQALNGDEATRRLALNVVSRLAQEAGVPLTRQETA